MSWWVSGEVVCKWKIEERGRKVEAGAAQGSVGMDSAFSRARSVASWAAGAQGMWAAGSMEDGGRFSRRGQPCS